MKSDHTAAISKIVSLGRRWNLGLRILAFASLPFWCGSLAPVFPASPPNPAPATNAVIDQYCVACHNDSANVAGLALNTANPSNPAEEPRVWEKVVQKLRTRYMPPAGLPRPDDATYDAVVSALTTSLDRAAAENPNPGRTDTFRRLNRTEYRNAIRDLLALDIDVSSLLPADETSLGFDNITVGELSPTLLERYLSAARKISRLAIGSPVRAPDGDTVLIRPDLTQEGHIPGLPFGTRGGAKINYNFPLNAHYDIQLRLTRDRDERVEGLDEPHQLELLLDGKRVEDFTVEPRPRGNDHSDVDAHLRARIPVAAGPHEIAATFLKKTAALVETERQPYHARFNSDRHPRTQPALYSISIAGPYDITGHGETPSRKRIFSCYPSDSSEEAACAKEILSKIIRRAYRRPVSDEDLAKPLSFYEAARAEGGFENGIEMALRAILVNPQFLFRIERDPVNLAPHDTYRISDLELASRISFFLWSSIPDDDLLDAAAQARLRQPEVLEQHVRRMLEDERSSALINNFASQWLYLRNLESTTPDPRLFPDFDDNLRQAFRRETELFVESILREDRSVLDLLRAKYSFVNGRLAKHYGIPNIYGSRFRRVEFGPDSVRGGLLSHGSILAVTSYATRTSPVIRGKWILTNILATPPPPPPDEVPALKEKVSDGKILSMRERVAQHRANPACASCHDLMDPVGFALENFDAIGRWRTHDDGAEIDASGSLPDGTKFEGAAELQQALLRRPEIFAFTVADKLLTYALGRGIEYYDAPALRRIVRQAAKQDYRLSSLILEVVKSTPFQMRRSQ